MGKIFYLMGKSASGKDSIYNSLIEDETLELNGVVMYSTRPRREGEIDGKDYFFVTPEKIEEFRKDGKVIESRTYDTVYGPWTYATIDDGQIDLSKGNYLMVGVLSAFVGMKEFFKDAVVPFYIEVEDGERLIRAINRERNGEPKYEEMCRRFLADAKDFSDENLLKAGVTKKYSNEDFKQCIKEIREVILQEG